MKKGLTLILACIYLVEVSGISLYKHFCMERLVSWGLTQGGQKCPLCGMMKEQSGKKICKGCCKDEHKMIKLADDHKAESFVWQIQSLGIALPAYFPIGNFSPNNILKVTANNVHAPPLKCKAPRHLFNCVFRI